jgi:uncharacterized SAM-binding protein YcdF (DUF218 family)
MVVGFRWLPLLVVLALGAAVLLVLGTRPIALWLVRPLLVSDTLRPVDAVIVLGNGTYDAVTPTPETAYRLVHALTLVKSGYAPVVMFIGGSHRGVREPDAVVMASIARAFGVEPAVLIIDPEPTTTAAQAASVAQLAGQYRIRSVAVVTSPLHSYRASRAFRRAGLEVVSVPGPSHLRTAPSVLLVAHDHFLGHVCILSQALYEYAALSVYWWRGWI